MVTLLIQANPFRPYSVACVDLSETLLPEYLQDANYATHLVGKYVPQQAPPQHGYVITCLIRCLMTLLIHSQNSEPASTNLGKSCVISSSICTNWEPYDRLTINPKFYKYTGE